MIVDELARRLRKQTRMIRANPALMLQACALLDELRAAERSAALAVTEARAGRLLPYAKTPAFLLPGKQS